MLYIGTEPVVDNENYKVWFDVYEHDDRQARFVHFHVKRWSKSVMTALIAEWRCLIPRWDTLYAMLIYDIVEDHATWRHFVSRFNFRFLTYAETMGAGSGEIWVYGNN